MRYRKSIYNVNPDKSVRTVDGITFDSQLEMNFYIEMVKPKYLSGDIIDFELQKKYVLQPKFEHEKDHIREICYVADFWIKYKSENEIVVDTKGYANDVALLKRKLFWFKYPEINYIWITYSKKYGGWRDYNEVQKLKRADKKKNYTK